MMIVFYRFYEMCLGDCDAKHCPALATAPSREQVMTARGSLWMGSNSRIQEQAQKDLETPVFFKSSPVLRHFKMFLRRLEFVTCTVLTHHHSVSSLVQGRGEAARVLPAVLGVHRALPWTVAYEILPVRAVKLSRGTSTTSGRPRSTQGGEEIVRWPALGGQCRPGPVSTSGAPGIPCLLAGEVRAGRSRSVSSGPPHRNGKDSLDLQKPVSGEARGDGHPGSGGTGCRDPRVARPTRHSEGAPAHAKWSGRQRPGCAGIAAKVEDLRWAPEGAGLWARSAEWGVDRQGGLAPFLYGRGAELLSTHTYIHTRAQCFKDTR